MEEQEMRNRLKKGVDPLELSIFKWRDIRYELKRLKEAGMPEANIVAKVDNMEKSASNCALCTVYRTITCTKFLVVNARSIRGQVRPAVVEHLFMCFVQQSIKKTWRGC